MYCTRTVGASAMLSKQSAAQALKALNGNLIVTSASRPICIALHQRQQNSSRHFSTTKQLAIKDFFPPPRSPHVKTTAPAWHHPMYSEEQMEAVKVAHRDAKTFSDKFALNAVKVVRGLFDFVTGYKHIHAVKLNDLDPRAAQQRYRMNERKYLIRNIFLESIAGVPGMVAGMLRHMRSMRRMKRDNGWMETLLEESYNERMHLLTFMQMAEPGLFMRTMVLGAQGVFFNGFFIAYLLSPKTCHRFVGYLEEEACLTYTKQIEDLDAGKLPTWEKMEAPSIAIDYWKMPEGKRSMRDLLLYIRADESKHREVNHTLGNLNQRDDPNPYVSVYTENSGPHPGKDLKHQKPEGWEREECI